MTEIRIIDPKTGQVLGRITENGETEITEAWKDRAKKIKPKGKKTTKKDKPADEALKETTEGDNSAD